MFDEIEPIGSQPFCRCNRQRGYYLNTHGGSCCWDYRISENSGFSKMYFERTPELSERLCEEFEHGCKLFPDDDLSSFSSVIEKIQNTKEIPEGWGYRITRQLVLHLSEEEHVLIDKMNKDWNPELFANREGIVPSPFWILK